MIRKSKKQFLVLLMSATLIGSNISLAYATEATDAKAAAADTAAPSDSGTDTSGTENPASESTGNNSASESSGAQQTPSTPEASAPEPSAPEPSAPEPSAPEPSAPDSSGVTAPAPSAPSTDASAPSTENSAPDNTAKPDTEQSTDTNKPDGTPDNGTDSSTDKNQDTGQTDKTDTNSTGTDKTDTNKTETDKPDKTETDKTETEKSETEKPGNAGNTTQTGGTNTAGNAAGTGTLTTPDGQDKDSMDTDSATDKTPDAEVPGTDDTGTAPGATAETPVNPGTAGTAAGTGTDAAETEGDVLPDDAAAAEGTTEGSFTNKNGEEVDPSTLVGVDYTTIADGYDGETNVIKQYAVSDSQEANTIMDSYLDENGNLIMIISQGSQPAEATAEEDKGLSSVFGTNSAPSIDGNFTGWDDIPSSYEYNWDNSANCWQYGNWVTDPVTGEQVCYKTEEGTYDSNVRHEMQLYTDNENVYLKIKYATIYGSHANGEDFNFYVDGVGTKYQITWADGTPITGTSTAAGTYVVDVRNGDSASSYGIVDGASAYYHVTDNGINNELELKIPLSALQAQNGSVNLDNFSMIQFFTPNLMYNKISAAGSPTGAEPFAAAAFLFIPASYVWLKKKNEREGAFA